MYEIDFGKTDNPYELNELVRMFLPPAGYRVVGRPETELPEGAGEPPGRPETELPEGAGEPPGRPETELPEGAGEPPGRPETKAGTARIALPEHITNKNDGKRYLFDRLSAETGMRPDWGILTGVRPVKLAGEVVRASGSTENARRILRGDYRMSAEKAELLLTIWRNQQSCPPPVDPNTVALYVGIPFCPTRCLYCSFPAYPAKAGQTESYLAALDREIEATGRLLRERGYRADSLYIGGGTPTVLDGAQLDTLLKRLAEAFDFDRMKERTVETGRPDTVSEEKLRVLTRHGVGRICINPQTMHQKTLDRIGRRHTPEQIVQAYALARQFPELAVNMDLIAGLPGETEADFADTLDRVLALRPENVTVHTLAVKRASRLRETDELYSYRDGGTVRAMLAVAYRRLAEEGYEPYYLYRQKQMAGNFENVGFSLPGHFGRYNIRTMEEDQTIVALGAGGISKRWYPAENRLVRIPNVNNYEIYIDRIDEMIERKRKGLN